MSPPTWEHELEGAIKQSRTCVTAHMLALHDRDPESLVCTENLNPDVVVMKSAKDRVWTNDSGPLNGARDRRIFIQ
jgi:hypothetical protein